MKNVLIAFVLSLSTFSFAGEVEPLLGYTVGSDGVTFQVFSGGCTRKESFTIRQMETFPVQILLERNGMDRCEAFLPYGTTVTFSWSELGLTSGSELVIGNPSATIRVY